MRTITKNVLGIAYACGVTHVRSRRHLPLLLNARRLTGQGAEIGVSRGLFSEQILQVWRGRKLYSVDSWKEFAKDEYRDITNVRQKSQEAYYAETQARLAGFGERSCIWRMTSAEAANEIEDRQLDFVYIDAQHHYAAVKEDILLWFPKLKHGGVLSGHDYVDGRFEVGEFGVKSAVDEFVAFNKLKLHVTSEPLFPSWFAFIA